MIKPIGQQIQGKEIIMKKILGSLLLMTTAYACPKECPKDCPHKSKMDATSIFQGFKVGGNLGVGFGKARHRFYGGNDIDGSQNNDLGIVGIDGGLNAGYDHVFEGTSFLLGLEGVANWSSAQGFQRTTSDSLTQRTKAALKHSLQLKGRLGYVMDKTLIYGVMGWDNGYWDFESSLSGIGAIQKKGYISGLITGAGIETYITQKVSLGIEYNNIAYHAQTLNIPNSDGAKTTLNPHHHKVMGTVKYTF